MGKDKNLVMRNGSRETVTCPKPDKNGIPESFFTLVQFSLKPEASCLYVLFPKSKICLEGNVLRMESSHTPPNTSIYFLRRYLTFSGEKENDLEPVTVSEIQVLFFADLH